MKQIETKLHELHAQSSSNAAAAPMEVNGEHHAVNHVAFACIDRVDSGSPASLAVMNSLLMYSELSHCRLVIYNWPSGISSVRKTMLVLITSLETFS